jgi:hypothetical protein
MVRVAEVAGLRRKNTGGCGIGEVQELLDLMRADIADDAAGDGAVEEPGGARRGPHLVRAETRRLDDAADCPLGHQLACFDRAAAVPMLVGVQPPEPAGRALNALDLHQLLERGYGWLIREHVLRVA